jgi:hypothetical protein
VKEEDEKKKVIKRLKLFGSRQLVIGMKKITKMVEESIIVNFCCALSPPAKHDVIETKKKTHTYLIL